MCVLDNVWNLLVVLLYWKVTGTHQTHQTMLPVVNVRQNAAELSSGVCHIQLIELWHL